MNDTTGNEGSNSTVNDLVRQAVMASNTSDVELALLKHDPNNPESLGSVFDQPVDLDVVLNTPWAEVTEAMKGSLAYFPGCRYFTAPLTGTVGVVNLTDFHAATKVVLRDPKGNLGTYGGFLCAEIKIPTDHLPKTPFSTLILGPEKEGSEKLVLYTVHPGPAMPLSRVDRPQYKDKVVSVHEALALGFRYAQVHILREPKVSAPKLEQVDVQVEGQVQGTPSSLFGEG